MTIRRNNILIEEKNPFKNCVLNRAINAHILSNIIKLHKDGFVLSINGPWGGGKTTFVKMWQQTLINDGFRTLYFNAWENDITTDPTIAILGELKKILKSTNEETFNKVVKSGALFAKKIIPGLGKAIAAKYIDTEVLSNIVENVLDASTELFEKEVSEYTERQQKIDDFRNHLKAFIEKETPDKPLIFFVDELDRCRPDYAVETLEKIKHFFSVEGIVFVLSIDKDQLGNSIRGFYGSDRIDSDEYLRRFIDIEYHLPDPEIESYTKYMFDYYDFESYFSERTRRDTDERSDFIDFSSGLFKTQNLTLRQIEKLYTHARLAISYITNNYQIHPGVLLTLLFLKNIHPSIYHKIKYRIYDIQSLADVIEPIFLKIGDTRYYNYTIAQIIVIYDEYSRPDTFRTEMLIGGSNLERELLFTSKVNQKEMIECIGYCRQDRYYKLLERMIKTIDLHQNFI